MSIGIDETRQVAALARLELSDAELGQMAGQLSAILDFVDQLRRVPTAGVEPLAHSLPVHNVFRDDEVLPSLPVNDALANSPQPVADPNSEGAFFGVPAVLD